MALVLLAGCAAPAGPSASPGVSASDSVPAPATSVASSSSLTPPSPTAAPVTAPVVAGNPWIVATELEVGPAPEGSEDVRVNPGSTPAGSWAWVLDESADGAWLLVTVAAGFGEAEMRFGWIPAVMDGRPSLDPVSLASPSPAAETCRTKLDDGSGPVMIDPRLSVLLCRSELVLTDAERLAATR